MSCFRGQIRQVLQFWMKNDEEISMDLIEMDGVRFCKMEKGQTFLQQGEPVEMLYYLTQGTLYRSFTTARGDEVLYGIKKAQPEAGLAQSLVGVLSLYSDGAVCNTSFTAMTECEGYMVPCEVFLNYVKDKPELLTDILRMAMSEYHNLMTNYQAHQEKHIANRLCQVLLNQSARKPDGCYYVSNISNMELAGFLGIHQVTVSKILKRLKEKPVIKRTKKGWQIIDREQLEQLAAGDKLEYH